MEKVQKAVQIWLRLASKDIKLTIIHYLFYIVTTNIDT
jgi:hypothetical protein